MIIQKVLYYYSRGKARLYVRGFELEAGRSLTQSSIGVHTYLHNKNWNNKLEFKVNSIVSKQSLRRKKTPVNCN